MPHKKSFKIIQFSNPIALHTAKTFCTTGIIHVQGQYCYLKVDDEYIHSIYPLLAQHALLEKPSYFTSADDIGAHISIIYPEEHITVQEKYHHQVHPFSITGLITACYENTTYYALSVVSPSLVTLRRQHLLASNPTFKGQEIVLHITVGVAKKLKTLID